MAMVKVEMRSSLWNDLHYGILDSITWDMLTYANLRHLIRSSLAPYTAKDDCYNSLEQANGCFIHKDPIFVKKIIDIL